jgi:TRAP-type C4-dicarboxylate transport system permease small subunit
MLFIYAIAFASGLAYRGNYFVFLEAFYAGFSNKMKKIIDLISPLMTLFLFGITAFYSLYMVEMGGSELSPSLQIIMVIPFLSILILCISISYFSCLSLLKKIKYWKS